MSDKNAAQDAVKGVVEGAKGKVKEAVGTVTGRDDMIREGHAQQDKAESQRDAAKKEAQAEQARAEAHIDEQRQKADQDPES
ncbi:CsbD family protein [Mycolicibacillus parakoreensis]|uniref:CsbD family protein n=1 Tax=Mycolicibacillus parakoreensis TaxID=1069221 RepID=A0ABY3U1J6_9MYCO|nr:CsbD family protein [Mycolicibacillus parakoreensis]MCV7315533.1 CsbD family protein [Mycolicibacillus parakoreensis]ULN52016.1 CsbD family protein [Mycolicibacillus parakoreensis]